MLAAPQKCDSRQAIGRAETSKTASRGAYALGSLIFLSVQDVRPNQWLGVDVVNGPGRLAVRPRGPGRSAASRTRGAPQLFGSRPVYLHDRAFGLPLNRSSRRSGEREAHLAPQTINASQLRNSPRTWLRPSCASRSVGPGKPLANDKHIYKGTQGERL